MANNSLPPFGIRGLHSPSRPFSILQISEKDYGETLCSHPESALTWLDEDDGETITVGTAWELRERLDETPSPAAPKVTFYNTDTEEHENRYIHLFDISRSHASVNVWREHEAYFSKTQIPIHDSQDSQSVPVSSVSPAEENLDAKLEHTSENMTASVSQSVKMDEAELETSGPESATETLESPDRSIYAAAPDLAASLGKHMGHIADFLQTTADALRKAADKTREADTTPIQDVLVGMTNVLGEVGTLSLDVIDKIRESVHEAKSRSAASVPAPAPAPQPLRQTDYTVPQPYCSFTVQPCTAPIQSNVEWAGLSTTLGPRAPQIKFEEHPGVLFHRKREEEMRLVQDLKSLDEDWQRSNSVNTDPLKIAATTNYYEKKKQHYLKVLEELRAFMSSQRIPSAIPPTPSAIPIKAESTKDEAGGSASAVTKSILDQEAEAADADFAARYPPLMSLRRAKTVGALPKSVQQRVPYFVSNFPGESAPARPSPQVFDAETQRRKAFALSCFPGQQYTPGPGTTYRQLPALRKPPFTATATEIIEHSSDNVSISEGDVSSLSQSRATSHTSFANASQCTDDLMPDIKPTEDNYQPLPGAWPDAKAEKPSPMPSSESSGAFFNRMVRNADSSVGEFPSMGKATFVQSPLRRYGSLANHTSKPKKSGDLRRAQTVTASTNPAARLNGPFDPVYPAPMTMQTTEEEEPLLPKSNNGPIRYAHRTLSDRRPRSFYEPYKSMPSPRGSGFEPVWEDSLHSSVPDPGSTVVFVDAGGFAPDTTEQSIRDLIAYEFNREIGQNALISCRITATEPVVLAKLVIRHKNIADKIILRLNGHVIGKHQLHFEYTKRGIDGRINRIRGAITDADTENDHPDRQIRPMQSLPNFASNTLHRSSSLASKPPFVDFQSRSRPVSLREPFPPPMSKSSDQAESKPVLKSALKQETKPEPVHKPAPGLTASVSYPILPPPPQTIGKPSPVELCESTLRSMGYGDDDQELDQRLKVYAAAAHGVVEDAIEMIEQDQQATHGVKLADDEVPDCYDSDLEQAIKNSMEER